MAQRHLWNCPECENEFEIESRNAGNPIQCPHCAANLKAPTFREIQNLPLAQPTAEQQKRGGGRIGTSSLKSSRWAFVIGFIMLVGGLLAGGACYIQASSTDKPLPKYQMSERLQNELEDLSLTEMVQYWDTAKTWKEHQMKEWREHPILAARRQAALLRWVAIVALVIALIGLGVVVVSYAYERKSRLSE